VHENISSLAVMLAPSLWDRPIGDLSEPVLDQQSGSIAAGFPRNLPPKHSSSVAG